MYKEGLKMRYIVDNDLHIHSKISLCSNDDNQTNERILQYAKENNLKTICLTDHFWDESIECKSKWYSRQPYSHIVKAKPLPQDEKIRFLFGCETDIDYNFNIGISKEKMDLFDFIVVPTTHLHMKGFTVREKDVETPEMIADIWVERLDKLLDMDLPFEKIGIAHLTCNLMAPERENVLKLIEKIPDEKMEYLFKKAAHLKVGIELNAFDMNFKDNEADIILRPYKIAKKCGCKFYCASDAHHPEDFEKTKEILKNAVSLLELTEKDKFII